MIARTPPADGPLTLRRMLARGHLRLVLLAVFLASVSLMISGVIALRGYAAQNVALSAETLSYTVEPALVFDDREAAAEIVRRLGVSDNLARIVIEDASGAPVAQWQRDGGDTMPDTSAVSRWLGLGPISREIAFEGQVVGTVQVTGSLSAIYRYAAAALVIALCCLSITVLATRILARTLEESIVVPLDHIADIANDVINERRMSRRIAPSGIAEIDQFTSNFNILLAELEEWHDSLSHENAELARRADKDALTGLGNRALFDRTLVSLIGRANGQGEQMALLFCDCNGFKQVNDTFGHMAGDAALVQVAEVLLANVRESDAVGRLGGDEFALLLLNAGPEEGRDKARRLAEAMARRPFEQDGTSVPLGGAIGVRAFTGHTDPEAWLAEADAAMWVRKRGRS
jgi:diguanylate cyclase (GGDEF)-like protein